MPADSDETARSTGGASTQVSTVIDAPRSTVYRAFLDPEAVAAWLPPDGMTGHVHLNIAWQYLNAGLADEFSSSGA